ncbi:hypothetical protein J2X72_000749 [Phyllobacterium sp. 1468]|nr:hypothetical protein [Phyllobacterium sp. 1468]
MMSAAAYDLLWITFPILVFALIVSIPRNEPPTMRFRSPNALPYQFRHHNRRVYS